MDTMQKGLVVETQPDESVRSVLVRIHSVVAGRCELRQVEFEVTEGLVLIRGSVTSFYAKQIAQEAVMKVVGHSAQVNNLLDVTTT